MLRINTLSYLFTSSRLSKIPSNKSVAVVWKVSHRHWKVWIMKFNLILLLLEFLVMLSSCFMEMTEKKCLAKMIWNDNETFTWIILLNSVIWAGHLQVFYGVKGGSSNKEG